MKDKTTFTVFHIVHPKMMKRIQNELSNVPFNPPNPSAEYVARMEVETLLGGTASADDWNDFSGLVLNYLNNATYNGYGTDGRIGWLRDELLVSISWPALSLSHSWNGVVPMLTD